MIDMSVVRSIVLDRTHESYADIRQDVMALAVSDFKVGGYFVEFGALDGVKGSNTLLLEREYDWTGILSEPARRWHRSIKENRSVVLDQRAVAPTSGASLLFKETDAHLGLSGLVGFFNPRDMHALTRSTSPGAEYHVETVSLTDLLDQHGAPDYVDYISVDTEGSECSILENFDFRRRIGLWTIEHNYVHDVRHSICQVMERNGYVRVLTDISDIDDWYVHSRMVAKAMSFMELANAVGRWFRGKDRARHHGIGN